MEKIGIVTTWFERGAAYVSRQIMDQLIKDGFEVYIYARGGEAYAKNDSVWDSDCVTWSTIKSSPLSTDIKKKHFNRWIDENEITTIIFNEQNFWQPVIWAKEKNIKTISYIDYYKEDTIKLFGLYDQLWCNTKKHYSVFEDHHDCKYIPWGTDIDLFKVESRSISPKIRFFHSAGMNPMRKGTDILINAAYELAKVNDAFECIIHTQTDLLDFFPDLSEKINFLIQKNIVNIINKTVPAPSLYHMGDVYVYPSRLDGLGLTIAEALSCGLPVLVTDEAPMNEFVEENECSKVIKVTKRYCRSDGYYWPLAIASINDLSEKMLNYIDDYSNIQSHQLSAREFAVKKLNWFVNAKSLSKFISKCEFHQIDSKIQKMAFRVDNKKLPFFDKLLPLYRLLFLFIKKHI